MPSTVKVRVKAARNLPLPDVPGNAANRNLPIAVRDSYVVVSLGGGQYNNNLALDDEFLEDAQPKSRGKRGFLGSANTNKPSYSAKTKVCKRTNHPVWDEDFRFGEFYCEWKRKSIKSLSSARVLNFLLLVTLEKYNRRFR